MVQNLVVRKRMNKILYFEFIVSAVFISIYLAKHFGLHFIIGLFIVFAAFMLVATLFFASKIFRYFFTFSFSFCFGLFGQMIGKNFDNGNNITGWLLGGALFIIAIVLHWEHFNFMKHTRVISQE